ALHTRFAKSLDKQILSLERKLAQYDEGDLTVTQQNRAKKLRLEYEGLVKESARHHAELRSIERQQKELLPENMAEELAKKLPAFTNAQGEQIKVYILPSPAYDGLDGIETARLLVEKNFDKGYRLLKSGADRQQ